MKVYVKGPFYSLDNIEGVYFSEPDGEYKEFTVRHPHEEALLSVVESRIRTVLSVPGLPDLHQKLLGQALEDLLEGSKNEGGD